MIHETLVRAARRAAMLLVVLASPAVSAAQEGADVAARTAAEDVAAALDAWCTYAHENGLLDGCVLVKQGGETVYAGAFGAADPATGRPTSLDTAFYLASVSKAFTCMGAMVLAERGELDLDAPLTDFFPEFAGFGDDVRVHHLMTHTSGVPDHYRLLGEAPDGLTNDRVLEVLVEHGALDFVPGTEHRYSNGGYVVLSMVVAQAAGTSFREFMDEAVFGPAGMTRTTVWDETEPDVGDRAVGSTRGGRPDDYHLYTTGAGGIFTTVGDLALWDDALAEGTLVDGELLERAFTPAVLADGTATSYGFGWGIAQGGRLVHHSGGLAGFVTLLVRDRATRDTVILLCNRPPGFDVYDLADAARAALDGREPALPRIPVDVVVRALIEAEGAEAALARYDAIRAEEADRYDLREGLLNALGYEYAQAGDLETAHAVLEKNCEAYPDAFNTWDSLAEIQWMLGRKDEALANYRRSLALEPDNANAARMIAEIEAAEG